MFVINDQLQYNSADSIGDAPFGEDQRQHSQHQFNVFEESRARVCILRNVQVSAESIH